MAAEANSQPGEDESLVVDLNASDEQPANDNKVLNDNQPQGKPPPVPSPKAAAPNEGLAELQRQMTVERQERAREQQQARQIAAERDQAIAFAQEAERRGVSTYELYNENQIRATQEQMENLAMQAEQAMQDGDFKRAATLNLKLGHLGGNLAVLERDQAVLQQQRDQMQRQPQQQRPAAQPQQQRPPVPTDPLERAIMGRTEPTKNFLRKHPEIVRGDGSLKRYAIDAHERALDEGHVVDSAAYFDYIERTIGANTPANDNGGTYTPRNAPTMAAPVSRAGSPGNAASGNGTFTMTPKMRRLAEEQGVTPTEWAKNYVRLLNEGRITPIT